MIILLSPAKTLDYSHSQMGDSDPVFKEESIILNSVLKKKSVKALRTLMRISEKLATENVARNNAFKNIFDESNSRASIYAFKGDVYRGFDVDTLKKSDLNYASKHLRILSGLYGILRPMDKMQPYRLEMGTKLKVKSDINLYGYWGEKLSNFILEELEGHKQKWIINLASNEYFKAVNHLSLKPYVLNVNFKEYRNDKLTFVSFNAKRARGLFARYMAVEKIKSIENLKGFNYEDYKFDESLSNKTNFIFTR